MFTLKNAVGNVYRTVATEQERARLIESGYLPVEEESTKPAEGKKGKTKKEDAP